MVTETLPLIKEAEIVEDAIAQEISDIVTEAETSAPNTEAGLLYYRMPFPGVRYYSFNKGASAEIHKEAQIGRRS